MFITLGAQRVTNTLTFTGCPTITDSNKKTTKRRHLRPLNRKRRNSFITGSNCRTASLGWGGRTQFDLGKLNYRAIPKVKTWSYFLTIPKGTHHLLIDQLSKVRTLYDTKLDEELLIPLKEKYPALFDVPELQDLKDQK